VPGFASDDLLARFYTKAAWPTLIAGPKGSRTGLHRDTHNFAFYMVLFAGKKWWRTFLDDDAGSNAYFRLDLNAFTFDPFDPDFHKYPRLQDATVYETVLEPGELIYIPEGLPHGVRNLEDTVAVSGNFLDARSLGYWKARTCSRREWSDSNACWGYDHEFNKVVPKNWTIHPVPYHEVCGYKDLAEWCRGFLPQLWKRAKKHADYRRNMDHVAAYCKGKGVELSDEELAKY